MIHRVHAHGERLAPGAGEFARVRRHVREQHSRLVSLADAGVPAAWRGHDVPMLTRPGWVLPRPVPLAAVHLSWHDNHARPTVRPEARSLMPDRRSYSQALVDLAGMSHLYDGVIYRPVRIDADPPGLRLGFTTGGYFGHLDDSELLVFEAAAQDLAGKPIADGRYRRALGDPFDLSSRVTCLGLVVLTVRAERARAGFYLHQRNGARVISGPDIAHAVPAGDFAPACARPGFRAAGFDLWHAILGEYAEEFLDVDEAYVSRRTPPDYEHDRPFSEITAARRSGHLRLHVLGVGLDTLTWTPELLLAGVIDAPVFDTLFAAIVRQGKEGTILAGPDGRGIPFEESAVDAYARDPGTRDAARACLKLAWRHRDALGLP